VLPRIAPLVIPDDLALTISQSDAALTCKIPFSDNHHTFSTTHSPPTIQHRPFSTNHSARDITYVIRDMANLNRLMHFAHLGRQLLGQSDRGIPLLHAFDQTTRLGQ